jgi:hypothetical protein
MHKYRQQLLFYKILVERSHSYHNYIVDEGSLIFVEPDDNGAISELSLTYNVEEVARTEMLIKAVWQRIMNLDFPDTSHFSPDLKGVEAFEDWLIANYT